MPDTFAITIISIVAVTIIGMFVQRRKRDRCLQDFSGSLVTLEMKNGDLVRGNLVVENTGLEIVYDSDFWDEAGLARASYILYKPEFVNIQAVIRFCSDLDEKAAKARERELEEMSHTESFQRLGRKLRNFINTIRDSLMEISNIFMGRVKATPAGAILSSQDKYIAQARAHLTTQGTAFEPMLERHMGKRVLVEVTRGEKVDRISGLLKEYTAEFIEIMDADYKVKEGEQTRKVDLIIPRSLGTVRNLLKGDG